MVVRFLLALELYGVIVSRIMTSLFNNHVFSQATALLIKVAKPTRHSVAVYDPTERQKHAGNYPKLHRKAHGFDFSIENPRHSRRYWGKKPSEFTLMTADYGYIKRTLGRDGDQIDVFLSPTYRTASVVHVVDQLDQHGKFDEHKCMIGWNTLDDAKKAYLSNYAPNWTGCGAITSMTMDDFKHWIKHGKKSSPVSPVVNVAGKIKKKK